MFKNKKKKKKEESSSMDILPLLTVRVCFCVQVDDEILRHFQVAVV